MDFFSCAPLFLLVVFLSTKGSGVKCYLCSFSPKDQNNRTDKCTEEHFSYEKVLKVQCRLGCETVVQYDANDELEQWHRNCLQGGLTNECATEKTKGWTVTRCSCNEDLCNASRTVFHNLFLEVLTIFTVCIWYSNK